MHSSSCRSNDRINQFFTKCCIVFAVAFLSVSAIRADTQLVMLEEHGCVYCAKFNREIGGFYNKTTEGVLAPLRRIDLYEAWPQDLKNVTPDRVTPTFILVHNDKEVGRLRGYQGDEFFWFLLNELIDKIPAQDSVANQ